MLSACVAGSVSGVLASMWYLSPQVQGLERHLRERLDAVTAPAKTPPVEIVRVEREPSTPLIPALFLDGRRSSTLLLVRHAAHPQEESFFMEENVLGTLSALTTDGWLLAPASLFEGVHLADLGVVWDGRVYPVTKAVRDVSTDLVYVKVVVTNLPVASFARAEDIVNGLPVWVESTPGRVLPQVLVDVRDEAFRGTISHERMTRRYTLNREAGSFPKGGVVWNVDGELVGIIQKRTETGGLASMIPVASVARTLSTLTLGGEIHRASLGIHGMNTALVLNDTTSTKRTARGFLLRGDRLHAMPAVDLKGPAAKFLKEGDVIERIDGDVIQDGADLAERLGQYQSGTTVPIYGTRAGVAFQVNVVLADVMTSETLK